MAWRHFHYWRRTGRISLLLLTEARNARIDVLINMATGLALLVTPLLGNTALAGIAPITDALVIAVSLVLLLEPLWARQEAMGQAAGRAADPRILQQTREVLMQKLSGLQLQMMDFTVQQLGRTAFVVVYINPLEAMDSAFVDGLRHHIDARCSQELKQPVRSEIP